MAKKNKTKKDDDTCIITRKFKLEFVGTDEEKMEVWGALRDSMIAQNQAMNQFITTLYTEELQNFSKDTRDELRKLFRHEPGSKLGSAYPECFKFATGYGIASTVAYKVLKDFETAKSKGLIHGIISLPSYRKYGPLYLPSNLSCLRRDVTTTYGLYHEYETKDDCHDELLKEHLYDNSLSIYLALPYGVKDIKARTADGDIPKKAVFKLNIGCANNAQELRAVIGKIFDKTYKICNSSIEVKFFENKEKELYLCLVLKIPKKNDVVLYEDVVVGANQGLYYPIVCAVNFDDDPDNAYYEKGDYFLGMKKKIKSMYTAAQAAVKACKGGHGRKKKARALDRFHEYEANFVQSYNHKIAKEIVDFALKHHAKYINLEYLKGFAKEKQSKPYAEKKFDKEKRLFLKQWSYFQLQSFIEHDANKYGIVVRKVSPAYDSQICSCCGHYEDGQRVSRKEFVCKNPECKNFGKTIDADFNAARNVVLDTDFIDEEEEREKAKKGKGRKKDLTPPPADTRGEKESA